MIQILNDKVAITPIFDPDRTPGGLYIPDVAKERCDQGIVKYIGPKVRDLKIGDYVLFGGYDGVNIELEDEGQFIMMRERYVKAIIQRPDTDINGLYFKAKLSKEETDKLKVEIKEILTDDRCGLDSRLQSILELLAHYTNEQYFTSTYEQSINIIASSFRADKVRTTNKIHDRAQDDHVEEIEEDE